MKKDILGLYEWDTFWKGYDVVWYTKRYVFDIVYVVFWWLLDSFHQRWSHQYGIWVCSCVMRILWQLFVCALYVQGTLNYLLNSTEGTGTRSNRGLRIWVKKWSQLNTTLYCSYSRSKNALTKKIAHWKHDRLSIKEALWEAQSLLETLLTFSSHPVRPQFQTSSRRQSSICEWAQRNSHVSAAAWLTILSLILPLPNWFSSASTMESNWMVLSSKKRQKTYQIRWGSHPMTNQPFQIAGLKANLPSPT